jgi:hypothetical protein
VRHLPRRRRERRNYARAPRLRPCVPRPLRRYVAHVQLVLPCLPRRSGAAVGGGGVRAGEAAGRGEGGGRCLLGACAADWRVADEEDAGQGEAAPLVRRPQVAGAERAGLGLGTAAAAVTNYRAARSSCGQLV